MRLLLFYYLQVTNLTHGYIKNVEFDHGYYSAMVIHLFRWSKESENQRAGMLERTVRSVYFLVLNTVVFSCSTEPDFNNQNYPPSSSDYYLKEYHEENRLLQSCEYENDRLFRFWV